METAFGAALQASLKLSPAELTTLIAAAQSLLAAQNGGSATASESPRSGDVPVNSASGDLPLANTRSWLNEASSVPALDPDLFRSAAWHSRWDPAGEVSIYAASSLGAKAMAERLGKPTFKPGVTSRRSPLERMRELSQKRYASAYLKDGQYIEEDGFDAWGLTPLPLPHQRPPGSPVSSGEECLRLVRPRGLMIGDLDGAVRRRLAAASLAAFIASDLGQAHCAERSLDPRHFERFTPRIRDGQVVYEAEREMVIMRPRRDAGHMASIVEAIVAEHVMSKSR